MDNEPEEILELEETKDHSKGKTGIPGPDFRRTIEENKTDRDHGRSPGNNCFYGRAIYVFFTFIWILLVWMNKFYTSLTAYVLLIPFAIFLLGFMNVEDTINPDVEGDVFGVTFINVGIIMSIPLLTLFNKEKTNPQLDHIVFMALICILLSYLPIWVDITSRHICKIIRSCLETFSITLYIYALTVFFIPHSSS